MNTKKGILFDMDGTLLNSLEEEAMKKILIALQKDKALILHLLSKNVNSYSDFIRILYQDVDTTKADKIASTIETILHQHYEDVELIKDARKFLTYAKAKGYHLSLCTNNASAIVSKILKDKNLEDFFDLIITSNDVKKGKPDPDMFLQAMHQLGLSQEECIIFEDSMVGIQAAKNANMDCIVVSNTKKDDAFLHIQDYSDPSLYKLF